MVRRQRIGRCRTPSALMQRARIGLSCGTAPRLRGIDLAGVATVKAPFLRIERGDMQLLQPERGEKYSIEQRAREFLDVMFGGTPPGRDDTALGLARLDSCDGGRESPRTIVRITDLIAQVGTGRRCGDHARQRAPIHEIVRGENNRIDPVIPLARIVHGLRNRSENQLRQAASRISPAELKRHSFDVYVTYISHAAGSPSDQVSTASDRDGLNITVMPPWQPALHQHPLTKWRGSMSGPPCRWGGGGWPQRKRCDGAPCRPRSARGRGRSARQP